MIGTDISLGTRTSRLKSVALALALLAGGPLAQNSQAVSILNGSFELGPPAAVGAWQINGPDIVSIPNWNVGGAGLYYVDSYWQAADGTHSLGLYNGDSSISQTLTGLMPGHTYRVSFALAGNPDGNPQEKLLGVTVNGVTSTYSFNIAGTSHDAMGWVMQDYYFTAIAASGEQIITFASLVGAGDVTGGRYGPALDNLSIAETPLPSTWLLMFGGVIAFGVFAYRSGKKGSVAIATA